MNPAALFSWGVLVLVLMSAHVTSGVVVEGDIIMTPDQRAAYYGEGSDPGASLSTGTAAVSKAMFERWPGAVVPYVLAASVKDAVFNQLGLKGPAEKAIRSAMKEWEQKTCIRFKPRTNDRDYIEFINGGPGKCYSNVGRQGGRQTISLGFGCFTAGIAMHEIGHALGLFHEHSRPDRDQYVEIVWNHIKEADKQNFRKSSHSMTNSLGTPYDYGSIMHFGPRAFAKWPWQVTIKPKKRGASIGQRDHLSAQDAFQVIKMYECNKSG